MIIPGIDFQVYQNFQHTDSNVRPASFCRIWLPYCIRKFVHLCLVFRQTDTKISSGRTEPLATRCRYDYQESCYFPHKEKRLCGLIPTYVMLRIERFTHHAALTPLVMYAQQSAPILPAHGKAYNAVPTVNNASIPEYSYQPDYRSTSNNLLHMPPVGKARNKINPCTDWLGWLPGMKYVLMKYVRLEDIPAQSHAYYIPRAHTCTYFLPVR